MSPPAPNFEWLVYFFSWRESIPIFNNINVHVNFKVIFKRQNLGTFAVFLIERNQFSDQQSLFILLYWTWHWLADHRSHFPVTKFYTASCVLIWGFSLLNSKINNRSQAQPRKPSTRLWNPNTDSDLTPFLFMFMYTHKYVYLFSEWMMYLCVYSWNK